MASTSLIVFHKEVQASCDLHNLKEFEKADQLGAMIYKLILALDRLLLADS